MFSRKNLPIEYYVYVYLREDGTPYYVGKGKGVRAWVKHIRTNGIDLRPKDLSKIKIIAHRLGELESLVLENKLIHDHGFKSDGGLLVNLKNGEFSVSTNSEVYKKELKRIHNTKEVIEKHRKSGLAAWQDPEIRNNIINGIDKEKRSRDTKNNWKNAEIRQKRIDGILKTTFTEEYKMERATRTGVKSNRHIKTIYNFIHISGIQESCTRVELSSKYGLDSRKLGLIITGDRKTHKGWKLNV